MWLCSAIDTADELFGVNDAVGKDPGGRGRDHLYGHRGGRQTAGPPSAEVRTPNDNKAYFPITTFHKLHPEVLDYWITLKYDDQKYIGLVQDEVTELLRRRRKRRQKRGCRTTSPSSAPTR